MLKIIAIAFVVLIAAVLVYAATKPDTFRIERTAMIEAPPEKIFALINDFRMWEIWSPWEKMDPALKRTYGGAESGKGAVYEWHGNKSVGEGRMEIIESTPPAKAVLKLDLKKPLEAHNTVEFVLEPQGDTTKITQAMYGPSPYISKLMGIFFSMDKMVGEKYEEGLATLKAVSSGRPQR